MKLKRTFFFCILAAGFAALPAAAQLNPEEAPPEQGAQAYKYEGYFGAAYTRIRQVPNSYSGLVGEKISLGRDWGKYFQLAGTVDYYTLGTGSVNNPSPGHPTAYTFMAAPTFHVTLYENLSGEFFGEMGGEHTGGESMTPNISFAGGFGGGFTYGLSHNFAVQLTGDRVGASFSLPNNTAELGYASHRTWNARVTMGLVYRF